MTCPNIIRLAAPATAEALILLRRFAALPGHDDQIAFMAACLNVVSGDPVEATYCRFYARAQAKARRVGTAAHSGEGR